MPAAISCRFVPECWLVIMTGSLWLSGYRRRGARAGRPFLDGQGGGGKVPAVTARPPNLGGGRARAYKLEISGGSPDEPDNATSSGARAPRTTGARNMAKKSQKSDNGVYRVTEIIGTSSKSWEDAARNAVETAGKSLRDLRIAEVGKLDMKVEGGKVVAYRARVSLSFKY